MHTDDALEMLADVETLRDRTSHALNADGWQWMAVWSVVSLGAGLSVLVTALEDIASFYWFVAVPVSLIATGLLERRSKQQRAVRRDPGRYWAIGGAIALVNFGAGAFLESDVLVVVIWVVIGLGFAGFALLDEDLPTAVMFGVAAVIAAVFGVYATDRFDAYGATSLLYAGLLAGSAVQVYSRYRAE